MVFEQSKERSLIPTAILASGTEIVFSNIDDPGLFFYNDTELGPLEGSQIEVLYGFVKMGIKAANEIGADNVKLLRKTILDFDMDMRHTKQAALEEHLMQLGGLYNEDIAIGVINNGKMVVYWYDRMDKKVYARSTTSNSNPGNVITIGLAARMAVFAGSLGELFQLEDYLSLVRLADGSCESVARSLTIVLNNRTGMEVKGPHQNVPIHPSLLRSKLHAGIIYGGTFGNRVQL